MHRRHAMALVAVILLAASLGARFVPASASDANAVAKAQAQRAAESWLAVMDSGRYAEAWSAAAALFRKAVTQEQWQAAARAAREPLGKLKSRTLRSATYTTSLPGAPTGEYVVLQYDAVFEHRKAAVETITPMRDPDGIWRVSGYYVR